MQIDPVELMQLFEATIGRDGTLLSNCNLESWKSDSRESYFDEHSFDKVQSLQQIISTQPNLLLALANLYEERGEVIRAESIREIERFLEKYADELESQREGIARLTGLVYPVV